MSFKKQKNETTEHVEIPKLTQMQLIVLEAEVNEAGSQEKWLIKQGAIRVEKDGRTWTVLQHSDGSFPYTACRRKLSELDEYISKREYAKRMEIYQTTGVMPKDEAFEKLKASMRELFGMQPIGAISDE